MRACFIALLALAGCLGESPEERLRAEQERLCAPGDRACINGSPEHRPGQACLACHGPDFQSADLEFLVAGTVYLRAGDSTGVDDAEVNLRDAAGHQVSVRTNRAGNFMVSEERGLDVPRDRGRGQLSVPWRLSYPIEVSVSASARETRMRSSIQREGSCAVCHSRPAGATSAGPVFVLP